MEKINKVNIRYHAKASEKYIDVTFVYENISPYNCSVPIEYRRTGTDIKDDDIDEYLDEVYEKTNPKNWEQWKKEQVEFWETKPGASITKGFFDILIEKFDWCCISCTLPQNPNWARGIQDLKEFGYTIATDTKRYCLKCEKNMTRMKQR